MIHLNNQVMEPPFGRFPTRNGSASRRTRNRGNLRRTKSFELFVSPNKFGDIGCSCVRYQMFVPHRSERYQISEVRAPSGPRISGFENFTFQLKIKATFKIFVLSKIEGHYYICSEMRFQCRARRLRGGGDKRSGHSSFVFSYISAESVRG